MTARRSSSDYAIPARRRTPEQSSTARRSANRSATRSAPSSHSPRFATTPATTTRRKSRRLRERSRRPGHRRRTCAFMPATATATRRAASTWTRRRWATATQEGNLVDQSHFGPETSDSLELGFKGQFLARRLTINSALFHTTFKDFQPQHLHGARLHRRQRQGSGGTGRGDRVKLRAGGRLVSHRGRHLRRHPLRRGPCSGQRTPDGQTPDPIATVAEQPIGILRA